MEKMTKKLSPFRLCSILRSEKDPNNSLKIFTSSNCSKRTDLAYDLIITKLCKAKMFIEVEKILEQMKQEELKSCREIIFCNVISSYGRAHMSEEAVRTFNRIPSFRCRRTVRSLNSLFKALLNCREIHRIFEIYNDLDNLLVPDVCTYNILINACYTSNLVDFAWKLFDEMLNKGISPNIVTFGTIISGLCANSRLEEAFKVKNEIMKDFNVEPHVCIYTSLIKAVCKNNDFELGFKLKQEMIEKKIDLDSAVYSTLISALFRVGRKSHAVRILEEMKTNRCKPDTVTYNAVIGGLCAEKDFAAAYGVLEMLQKECKPDVFSYNMLISAFCKDNRLSEARKLFVDMSKIGCSPDVVTYRILFDGFCDRMEYKKAASFLDEMVSKGFVPHVSSVKKFVKGLCLVRNVGLLNKALSSLIEGNCANIDVWEMVIELLCKRRESEAWEIVESLIMLRLNSLPSQ